jgi:hypothetical protein
MASKVTEDAIQAFLEANWTACPIFVPNVQGEAPQAGTAFIELQFPVADSTRMTVAKRLYREEGGFRVLINVEKGLGSEPLRTWGETLVAMFRDVQIGPVRCLVPSEPFVDDNSGEGNFYTAAFVVPFWRSYFA